MSALGLLVASGCQSSPETVEAEPRIEGEDSDASAMAQPPPEAGDEPPPTWSDGPELDQSPPAEPSQPSPPRQEEMPSGESTEPTDDTPSTPAGESTSTNVPLSPEDVTDAQIERFAAAYIEVMDLQSEYQSKIDVASDPGEVAVLQQELEQQSMQTVETHDVSPDEFNAIADLVADDTDFRDRVQSQIDELAQ